MIITRRVREAGIDKVISPHRLRATCSLYVKKGEPCNGVPRVGRNLRDATLAESIIDVHPAVPRCTPLYPAVPRPTLRNQEERAIEEGA